MVEENVFSLGAKKLLTYHKYIEAWLSSEMPIPIALEIHPTERCNHQCPGCQSKFTLKTGEVRWRAKNGVELDLSLLNSIWEAPPQGVILSGNTGDPLLHPQISNILGILRSKRIPIALVTNGQALTPSLSEQIVHSCQGVRISLDAYDASSFWRTHGVHSEAWHIVNKNLKALVDCRNRTGLTKDDCLIGIGYLTSKHTAHGMFLATKHARAIGVDYVQFRPFHYSNAELDNELRRCEMLETEDFKVFSSYQKYIRLKSPTRTYNKCFGAWFYTVLDARGDLYICCHNVGNHDAQIGSLAQVPWSQLLRSKNRRAVLNRLEVSKCIPKCRLDSHNRALGAVLSHGMIPESLLGGHFARHAPFL